MGEVITADSCSSGDSDSCGTDFEVEVSFSTADCVESSSLFEHSHSGHVQSCDLYLLSMTA